MKTFKSKKLNAASPKTVSHVPPIANEVLHSSGQPLDVGTRAFMESRFGHDFSRVRVHTDSKASESARAANALAYTVANHIAFDAGEYKPGTLIGDTLIAHELAHVLQQSEANSGLTMGSGVGIEDSRLEMDANSATVSTIASYGGKASTAFSGIKQNVLPSLKSGLRLQRCARAERVQAPAFFGRYSRETLDRINGRMESGAALQNWIAFGTAVISFEDPLAALDSADAAEALKGIPSIIKAAVGQDIDFLLLEHENELNEQERQFWNKFRSKL